MHRKNVCKNTFAKQTQNVPMTLVATVSSVKWEGMSFLFVISRVNIKHLIENNFSNIDLNLIFSYATSFVLEKTTGSAFEKFYEAGRRGRQGENCREVYVECTN